MTATADKHENQFWHETEMLEWFQVEHFFEEYGFVMPSRGGLL